MSDSGDLGRNALTCTCGGYAGTRNALTCTCGFAGRFHDHVRVPRAGAVRCPCGCSDLHVRVRAGDMRVVVSRRAGGTSPLGLGPHGWVLMIMDATGRGSRRGHLTDVTGRVRLTAGAPVGLVAADLPAGCCAPRPPARVGSGSHRLDPGRDHDPVDRLPTADQPGHALRPGGRHGTGGAQRGSTANRDGRHGAAPVRRAALALDSPARDRQSVTTGRTARSWYVRTPRTVYGDLSPRFSHAGPHGGAGDPTAADGDPADTGNAGEVIRRVGHRRR